MNKKMTYFAPETEQMEVRFEDGLLTTSTQTATSASFSDWSEDNEW